MEMDLVQREKMMNGYSKLSRKMAIEILETNVYSIIQYSILLFDFGLKKLFKQRLAFLPFY